MPEFEYRGYRIRTLFDSKWKARIWPPLHPPRVLDRIRATSEEGEGACRRRATRIVDAYIDRLARRPLPLPSAPD